MSENTDLTILLHLDSSEALDALSFLAETAGHSHKLASDIVEFLDSGVELFHIDSEGSATSNTGELTVFLKPSVGLRDFMSALRARIAAL